jgi:Uma2 family endonuclease
MPVLTPEKLLTATEFARLAENGRRTELVRGRIVAMNMPAPRHGYICCNASYFLRRYLDTQDRGRVMTNDSGVVTEHDPDTVRGADVSYYSYDRLPRGPLPGGYLDVVPEVIFEIRSPTDRWSEIITKVGEYLRAGVTVVCVLDQQTESAYLYYQEDHPQRLTADQDLTFPDILPGFQIKVGQFFA